MGYAPRDSMPRPPDRRPLIDQVPAKRSEDPGYKHVADLDATARDLRWDRSSGASIAVVIVAAAIGALWLFGAWLFGDDLWPPLVLALTPLAWALSGLLHLGTRSTRMGRRMGAAVRPGIEAWRALPEPARTRARPVAAALIAAGARHDVDGVRVRLAALDRLAQVVAAQDPGMRDDVDELAAWTDATEETHRDH